MTPLRFRAAALAAAITLLAGADGPARAAAPALASCPANAKKANLNFTLKDADGRPVRLSDYAGKVVLLDFWATWCAPCKIEIPAFIDLYKTLKPRGFEVVSVVVMDEFTKAKPFASQFGITYPVLNGVDRDDIDDAFGPLFALPTSLVIARDGRICARHIGLPEMPQKKDPSVEDVKAVFAAQVKALL
jgi:thiol-disulfide isomerase/thioredoxin